MQAEEKVSSSLASFFLSDDYCPAIPFRWPKNALIPYETDPVVLINTSCEEFIKHSKYVELNVSKLDEYAKSLNSKEVKGAFTPHTWNWEPPSSKDKDPKKASEEKASSLTNREIINATFIYCLLQFGSGYRKPLHEACNGRGASLTIGVGLKNMISKKIMNDARNFYQLKAEDISALFDIPYAKHESLKCLCQMIVDVLVEAADVITKEYEMKDFADYFYHYMHLYKQLAVFVNTIIKINNNNNNNIKNSATVTFNTYPLGIKLAPALKKNGEGPNRTYVLSCTDKSVSEKIPDNSVLYRINDTIVFHWKFEKVIELVNRLKEQHAKLTMEFVCDTNKDEKKEDHNDSPQYYQNICIFFFKRAQLILMELQNNLRPFKEKDMNVSAVIDNVVPCVLIKDQMIVFKSNVSKELSHYLQSGKHVLKAGELEAEIRAAGIYCVQEILKKRTTLDINSCELTFFLWKKGKWEGYREFERHYTRDSVFY
ncbi:hypothetical protein RFI_02111 [Reticulomyxa filosa]|uniref:Queuosine 5'-phosphate N-glycosylase/hydrolase n=1 Tax=Reticulomyxa filosa TaxID=46433 RepID=X6PBD1_RETFI|nr:hypothetical protein RFI_02111 [Reticulomyxa filosa]|eukprot:ETO34962.1 hypothetical protein RFI_02111 [Reticulomyxa filosa]